MARKSIDAAVNSTLGAYITKGFRIDKYCPTKRKRNQEEFRASLIDQLKRSPYLCPAAKPKERKMFGQLESCGLLGILLSDEVLSSLICHLQVFEIEQSLESNATPTEQKFHRSMIEAIDQHSRKIQQLLKTHRVSKDLVGEYLAAATAQIEKHFRAIRPFCMQVHPAPRSKAWNEMISSVYDTIKDAFANARMSRGIKQLSLQLTAIICSPSPFFDPGTSISDQAVRKIIERRAK
jgi:hypothetical protein